MITYYWFPQRSPAWYSIREGKWTGSTIIELLKGKKTIPEFSDYDKPLYEARPDARAVSHRSVC
jgi:hypothetical protein